MPAEVTWHDGPEVLPARRSWRVPEPLGQGTPLVESFTSYVERLALANRLLVRDVLSYALNAAGRKGSIAGAGLPGGFWNVSTYWLNGPSASDRKERSRRCVRAVSRLTNRSDLKFLTLLPWVSLFSRRALLRRQRAWCPDCHRDWLSQGRPVYSPLLWAVEAVLVCPVHERPLSLHCPNPACGRPQRLLDAHSRPGYCSHCNTPLDHRARECDLTISSHHAAHDWLYWIAHVVGEMLAASPALGAGLPARTLADVVNSLVKTHGGGSLAGLCHRLSLSVVGSTVGGWTAGTQRPRLDQWLELACRLQTTPLALLTQSSTGFQPALLLRPPDRIHGDRESLNAGQTILTRIRGRLIEAQMSEAEPPPTLGSVARQIGYPADTLLLYFPDQCRLIEQRRADYFADGQRARTLKLMSQVDRIAAALSASGLVPTQEQVMRHLPDHAFRDPRVRARWRDAITALGIPELTSTP